MYRLTMIELMLLAICLLLGIFYYRVAQFLPMLKRMRWLIMSMLLIYAFSTPGEYFKDWPIQTAQTYEGIQGGLLQTLRLSMMLAAVALLIARTTKQEMIFGFYCLLKPLSLIGFKPEKFAARLSLTLKYIELNNASDQQEMKWQSLMRLDQQLINKGEMAEVVVLREQSLSYYDYLVILVVFLFMGLKWHFQ